MQPMNYRKRVEDLEVEVRKLKSAKTECDCGEPMSQGQRRAIISTMAVMVLSFTGIVSYASVTHANAANSPYSVMNSQQIDSPDFTTDDSTGSLWIICNSSGDAYLIYSDNGRSLPPQIQVSKGDYSGPFDPDRSTDYAPMAPPKNCAASWYDN